MRLDPERFLLGVLLTVFSCTLNSRDESSEGPFQLGEEVFAVGAAEGSPEEIFGLIADLAFDSQGRLLVLDSQTPSLMLFSPTGVLLSKVGSEGDGPGEWSWPSSVDLVSEDRAWVLDEGHRHFNEYRIETDSLVFDHDTSAPFLARDFCVLGDRVFLLGLHEGHTVHEIDNSGEILASFGEPEPAGPQFPPSWAEIVEGYSRSGWILCHDSLQLVIAVPNIVPFVTAYRTDGEVEWKTELSSYSRTIIELLDGNRMRMTFDPETGFAHSVGTATLLGEQDVLVQLRAARPGVYPSELVPESRVLLAHTGAERILSDSLPWVGASVGQIVGTYVHSPYPRVSVHRLMR